MPKIEIREYDLTSPGRVVQNNEVVYIPGLVDTECTNLWDEDKKTYIGLKPFEPTLFTSVSEFTSKVGQHGYTFESDQKYTDIAVGQFNDADVPYHNTLFTAGSVDPSYVMAKELLAAGLYVVYERINPDKSLDALTGKPIDWPTGTYYKKADSVYKKLPRKINYFIQNPAGTEYDPDKSYYVLDVNDTESIYAPTTDTTGVTYTPATDDKSNLKLNSEPFYHMVEALIIDSENWTQSKAKNTSNEYTYSKKVYKVGTALTEEPSDWSTSYVTYFTRVGDVFKKLTASIAPAFVKNEYYSTESFAEVNITYNSSTKEYNPVFEKDKYCSLSADNEYIIIKDAWNALTYNLENTFIFDDGMYIPCSGEVGEDGKTYLPDQFPKKSDAGIYTLPATYEYNYSEFNYKSEDELIPYIYNKEDTIDFTQLYMENDHCDINSIYSNLPYVYNVDRENSLDDKGNVNIKYITSGGYPTYGYNSGSIAAAMLDFAENRNDCYALIDVTDNQDRSQNLNDSTNIYKRLKADSSFRSTYGTMFIPHMEYVRTTTDKDNTGKIISGAPMRLAASYGYLLALADSITVNPAWLAVAGASRGLVQNLASGSTSPITNKNADSMQPRNSVAINCITNIKPYGNVIWGNRTLSNNEDGNLTALSMLNIRNLVCDVKKICYTTAKFLTFEQNNEILWLNFKSRICPTLDQMLSGYGISKYKIERDYTREEALEKATVCARITLYPVYAVEDFYIDIILSDDEVTTEE